MSIDLKPYPSVSTFSDPVIHLPRPLPIFLIPALIFFDFTPFSFCFVNLPDFVTYFLDHW
jgi:hypothetical protein